MKYIFEWDHKKAKTNILKHQISFEDATSLFKYLSLMKNIVKMKIDG